MNFLDYQDRIVFLLCGFSITTLSLTGLISFLSDGLKEPVTCFFEAYIGFFFLLSLCIGIFFWVGGSNE